MSRAEMENQPQETKKVLNYRDYLEQWSEE